MSLTTSLSAPTLRPRRGGAPSAEPVSTRARRRREEPGISTRTRHRRLTQDEVAELVKSAKEGDGRAWDTLVREFSDLIRAIARSHRLSDADAGDVAQETWLRLFEHLDRIDDPARVGAWLATTARRECLRILRGTQRHVLFADQSEYNRATDAPADDALLAAERDLALQRCFIRLKGADQSLLMMLMSERRPGYEEISATLAMPVGSIGPTRARALNRLRTELDSEGSLALMSAA